MTSDLIEHEWIYVGTQHMCCMRCGKLASELNQTASQIFPPCEGVQPASTPTVRVRILVAVDDKGKWAPAKRIARIALGPEVAYRWIEADVPLPSPEIVVKGEVRDD